MLIPPRNASGQTLLSLDLGTRLGWALALPDGTIRHGVHVLPVEPAPRRKHVRWLSLRIFLAEIKSGPAEGGLDAVYYEHSEFAVMAPNARGMAKAQVLSIMDRGALYATVHTFCGHHGIALEPRHPNTIKKFITGSGNAKKAAVTAAVCALGYEVADDNEADALALLHIALADRESEAA